MPIPINWGPEMRPEPYAVVGTPLHRRPEITLALALARKDWIIEYVPERLRDVAWRRCRICGSRVLFEIDSERYQDDLPGLYDEIIAFGVEHHRRCPAAPIPENIELGQE